MESCNSQNPIPSEVEGARKILLIGDIQKAFLDLGNITQERYEFCPDILNAIDTAANGDFVGIGIVMAGISTKLGPFLVELRNKTDAKIILLAQMYEEPIAMYLVGSPSDGKNLADDYLICPVRSEKFYKSFMAAEIQSESEVASPVDTTMEEKIKHLEEYKKRLKQESPSLGWKRPMKPPSDSFYSSYLI